MQDSDLRQAAAQAESAPRVVVPDPESVCRAVETATPDVVTRVINDLESLQAIGNDWRSLSSLAEAGCVFNSSTWLTTWWEVFSTAEDQLQVWTAWQGTQLIALMPMYTRPRRLGAFKILRFLGTGEGRSHEVATEYSDLLVDPRSTDTVLPLAAQWLTSFHSWVRVELQCMLDSAFVVRALDGIEHPIHRMDRHAGDRYRIPLTPGEDWVAPAALDPTQKRVARSLRAVDRDGGLRRESLQSASDSDAALDQLAELNRQRQTVKGRRSSFSSDQFHRFHQSALPRLFEEGRADVHRFHIGDQLVAALYCFYDKDTAYYYQSGFSTDSANRYMPLTAAHLNEIEFNRSASRRFYDLMRAEAPTYKSDMANDVTPLCGVSLFCNGPHRILFGATREVRRWVVRGLRRVGITRS